MNLKVSFGDFKALISAGAQLFMVYEAFLHFRKNNHIEHCNHVKGLSRLWWVMGLVLSFFFAFIVPCPCSWGFQSGSHCDQDRVPIIMIIIFNSVQSMILVIARYRVPEFSKPSNILISLHFSSNGPHREWFQGGGGGSQKSCG